MDFLEHERFFKGDFSRLFAFFPKFLNDTLKWGIVPLKILPDGIFNWWSGTPGGSRFGGDWWERWPTDHFSLPLLLARLQEVSSYFLHVSLERADL